MRHTHVRKRATDNRYNSGEAKPPMARRGDLTTVGGRLREAREVWSWEHREQPSMTQGRLSELMRVNQSTVSSWERNAAALTIPAIEEIAAILGVSPSWLAFGEGEPRVRTTSGPIPVTGRLRDNAERLPPETPSRHRRES